VYGIIGGIFLYGIYILLYISLFKKTYGKILKVDKNERTVYDNNGDTKLEVTYDYLIEYKINNGEIFQSWIYDFYSKYDLKELIEIKYNPLKPNKAYKKLLIGEIVFLLLLFPICKFWFILFFIFIISNIISIYN